MYGYDIPLSSVPLRVCWYAAFPLRWLVTLLKPAYFVTRGFTAAFYIYIYKCVHIGISIYVYIYIYIYRSFYHTYKPTPQPNPKWLSQVMI